MTIISSVEKFLKAPLINNTFWINYSVVSLEVLITFIAIDSYLQTFARKSEEMINQK